MIDRFSLLANARNFYSGRGYTYIEVPWIVSREAVDLTLPAGSCPHVVAVERPGFDPAQPEKDNPDTEWNDWRGYLVGSAEQSFAQMILDGNLPMGEPFMAITPCFRDDKEDMIHFEYFMKLELIYYSKTQELTGVLMGMRNDALTFFEQYLPVRWENTTEGYDLVSRECGIELGSYGIRIPDGPRCYGWVYGTGLAQPRLNQVLDRVKL